MRACTGRQIRLANVEAGAALEGGTTSSAERVESKNWITSGTPIHWTKSKSEVTDHLMDNLRLLRPGITTRRLSGVVESCNYNFMCFDISCVFSLVGLETAAPAYS